MDGIIGFTIVMTIIGLVNTITKLTKAGRKDPNQPQQTIQRVPTPQAPNPAAAQAYVQQLKAASAQPYAPGGIVTPMVQPILQAAQAPKMEPAKPAEKTEIERALNDRKQEHADKEGCIGGSIPHTQHEGESRAEHAEHMKRAAVSAVETPGEQIRKSLSAAEMRKAVIMSEILDRPKALRRRI